MKNLILFAAVAAVVWFGYDNHRKQAAMVEPAQVAAPAVDSAAARASAPVAAPVEAPPAYACDGRTHCSQMRSCEEATWVLRNCPNTKMDGNGDGVPCEREWCGVPD